MYLVTKLLKESKYIKMLSSIFLCICTFCNPWWLLPLLALSWLLGWLFWSQYRKRYTDEIDSLKGEGRRLNTRITDLEKELSTSKYEYDKLEKDYRSIRGKNADLDLNLRACQEKNTNLEASIASGTILPVVDTTSNENTPNTGSSSVPPIGKAFNSDNLQVIEGIGPKLEKLLKEGGLRTWQDLANADVADIQKILDAAGPNYRIHNPKTWPEQARLTTTGDWDELIKYQKFLDTGLDNANDIGNTPAKVEKLYAKLIGFAVFKPNDLKIIEGIGPKIEALLHNAGINTWAALADTDVGKIKDILKAAGDRFRLAKPDTWPRQAALAAASKWGELKEYQDFLDGGRE